MAMTLRLTPDQAAQLDDIREALRKKTATAALKYMIERYGGLISKLSDETHRADQAEAELASMKAELKAYLTAKDALETRMKEV